MPQRPSPVLTTRNISPLLLYTKLILKFESRLRLIQSILLPLILSKGALLAGSQAKIYEDLTFERLGKGEVLILSLNYEDNRQNTIFNYLRIHTIQCARLAPLPLPRQSQGWVVALRAYNKMQSSNNAPLVQTLGPYTILPQQIVGKGSTGTVYRGYNTLTRQPIAVKAIDLTTICDQATRSLFENQKEGLRLCMSPGVLKLLNIIEEGRYCYIVTELCEGCSLKEYLTENKTVGEKEAMTLFRKLTMGALAVTQEGVIHRDLKPANLIIDCKGNITIIDFGYCQIIRAQKVMKSFNVGSPSYMSPEAYLRTLYSQKSDAWSLGIILYELLHGHTLDHGMDIKRYFEDLKEPTFVQKMINPLLSPQVRETIEKALKYTPEHRLSISGLKYQTDLYHISLQQKNTSEVIGAEQIGRVIKQVAKVKFPQLVHSLKRVDSQNRCLHKGFVSFKDFTNEPKVGHQMKMKQMTSLQDFDANSMKAESVRCKGVAVDEKLNNFLHKAVKPKLKFERPSSQTSIPLCRTTLLSVRQINEAPFAQPKLTHHVTVRFN